MPYTKIAVHIVWTTKNREKIITPTSKPKLIEHIKENAKKKSILIDRINCVSEHIHVLILQKPDQKLAEILQLIKGESSHWMNKNKLINTKFEWQDDYFANSVSESGLNNVRNYIERQEEHHSQCNKPR